MALVLRDTTVSHTFVIQPNGQYYVYFQIISSITTVPDKIFWTVLGNQHHVIQQPTARICCEKPIEGLNGVHVAVIPGRI